MESILEERLTGEDVISIRKRIMPFLVGLFCFVIAMELTKRLWLPGYRGILEWIQFIAVTIAMISLGYWLFRTTKSRMRLFPARERYYEGWVFHVGILILFGFSLFLGVFYFSIGLFLFLEGWNAALFLLVFGSFFLASAVFSLISGFRSKLWVEKEGILWKQGVLPFTPPIYFLFDEVGSVELWGPILSFKGTKQRPRWFIVQNRKKLASALDIVLKRE